MSQIYGVFAQSIKLLLWKIVASNYKRYQPKTVGKSFCLYIMTFML